MCHRIVPLSLDEVEAALENRARNGRAIVPRRAGKHAQTPPDAFPRSEVAIIVRQPEDARLKAALLSWGFWSQNSPAGNQAGAAAKDGRRPIGDAPAKRGVIFNTRLETALDQLRSGHGLWAEGIAHGRCLIPVRAFYEQGSTETATNPATGTSVRHPYRFSLAGSSYFLLAGIAENGRFSIVTTPPNADVSPMHHRMPLVLGRGESELWLDGDPQTLARLADRSAIRLDVQGE